MKYIIFGVLGAAVLGYVFFSETKPTIDLARVLERSTQALERYDTYLKQNNIEKATDEHLEQLNAFLTKVMNAEPPVHDSLIATRLGKDAKFTGVEDANQDGIAGEEETTVFTVELDAERKRLIATDPSGDGTSRGFSGSGFLAGILIGSMLGRQRTAGVTPASFANRKLAPPTTYSAARGRARSGGLRGGK